MRRKIREITVPEPHPKVAAGIYVYIPVIVKRLLKLKTGDILEVLLDISNEEIIIRKKEGGKGGEENGEHEQ